MWNCFGARQKLPPQRQRRLLASLAESGQQTSIVVVAVAGETDRYLVIDGYQRVTAVQQLGRDTGRPAMRSRPAAGRRRTLSTQPAGEWASGRLRGCWGWRGHGTRDASLSESDLFFFAGSGAPQYRHTGNVVGNRLHDRRGMLTFADLFEV
jgi:hypothetical protein